MGNFNNRGGAGSKPFHKPSFGGGRGGFGGGAGRGGFGGGRRDEGGEREMHTATCADCGDKCQVPFRPNGTKPVYCSNCFKRDEAPRYGGSENNGVFERPRFDREERPRFEKPAFAPARPAAAAPSAEIAQLKTQLDIMHTKLDRILKLVSPTVVIEPVAEAEEEVEVKPKAKKKASAK